MNPSSKSVPTYEFIETESGNNFFMVNGTHFKIVQIAGDNVLSRTRVNITPQEFADLANKVDTHHFRYDKISGKIMLEPKKQPKSESQQ